MRNNWFKKCLVVGIIVLLLGVSIIPITGSQILKKHVSTNIKTSYIPGNTRGNILYVGGSGPDNYTSIQDAIDDANPGDTVFVYDDSSPYYENVVVNKTINLIGEDRDTTVINGSDIENVVHVSVNWVNISGFTIQNSGFEYGEYVAGIKIRSQYNTIADNIISSNDFGIFGDSSSNTIIDNVISNNHFGIGLVNSSSNTIIDNVISNNHYGIGLVNSSSNTIKGNTISNNEGEGIYLSHLNSSIITGNTITDNDYGIFLSDGESNTITGNTISNNDYGIGLLDSSNIIYHNNFINNREINAFDTSDNIWDDGKYGNYWSDYKEKYPDAKKKPFKGIWDTPYEIPGGDNKDMCPLIKQWPNSLSINMLKNEAESSSLFQWFLERFPILQIILLYLIK